MEMNLFFAAVTYLAGAGLTELVFCKNTRRFYETSITVVAYSICVYVWLFV